MAAGARAAIGGRRIKPPEALRRVRLQDAPAPQDHRAPDLQVVRAARLSDRACNLVGRVVDMERHPLRFADRGKRRRAHFHQRQPAGIGGAVIGVRDAKEIAEVFPVVRSKRQDVRFGEVGLDLGDRRGAEHVRPAADHVVGARVIGTRIVAGRRATDDARRVDRLRSDGHRRAQARRDRVGLVVGIAREDGVVVVEPMIDAEVGRLVVLRTVIRERVVVGQRAVRGHRIERHVLRRDRIETLGGNHVPREGSAHRVHRVVDRRGELGEIARPHLHGRNRDEGRHALPDAIAFVVGEKEGLARFDWAAEAAAVLVLAGDWLAFGKEETRIESLVPAELEPGTVELVAARLRDDVDDAAERPARLGRVHVGLHPHFGNRINRGLDGDRADAALVVVHAVDELIVQHVVDAVDRDRRGLPPLVGPCTVGQRADCAFAGAGNQLDHADDVAPRYGCILHRFLVDERADGCRIGLQQRRHARHDDALFHGPELQPRIDARAIAGGELHARVDGLEARQLDPHGVDADRQESKHVVTGATGDRRTYVFRGDVFRGHRHRGQHPPARVGHAAGITA